MLVVWSAIIYLTMADIDATNVQQSVCKNGRFQNPWPTWSTPKFRDLFHFMFTDEDKSEIPTQEVRRFVFIDRT